MNKNERVICFCKGTTEEDIRKAVRAGAETADDAEEMLGCGSVCGECRRRIQELMDSM